MIWTKSTKFLLLLHSIIHILTEVSRNNERGELEDQISKYTQQIFDLEKENKALDTKISEQEEEIDSFKKRVEELQTSNGQLRARNEAVISELEAARDSAGSGAEAEAEAGGSLQEEQKWEEIISELEERIEVRTWHEYFAYQRKTTKQRKCRNLEEKWNLFDKISIKIFQEISTKFEKSKFKSKQKSELQILDLEEKVSFL